MSVYTTITETELQRFLADYSVGRLVSYTGISEGIDNTNYFVQTDQGEFVLTVFERLSAAELPYFLDLLEHLHQHQVACARPIANRQQQFLSQIQHKPAAMVERLPGTTVKTIQASQCGDIGHALAQLHVAGQHYPQQQYNRRGLDWCQTTARALDSVLPSDEAEMVRRELTEQCSLHQSSLDLPTGTIHGDLFHDNVLYDGLRFSGMIDFYFACHDVLLYDLAVAINDWCKDPAQPERLEPARTQQLLTAYQSMRPLTANESQAFSLLLRRAALSWWLSRLYDKYFPREGELTLIKDPDVFKRLLQDRIQHRAIYQAWVN